ncbi:MAG: hypothetical protein CMJ65_18100 [Planctomycetaceae bacterium]|nr:hypothetical protein [Planctomycetaceae bacterium]MDP7277657.1 prepilin peptidase [Planctomycetaceae bacterium]
MILFGLPTWFVLPSIFIVGTVIGSFLNVCIHRLPEHDSPLDGWKGLWHPPSHCPRCLHSIRLFDNVPIFGWIRLGGRCRDCRGNISIRYPLVEFFNGLLLVVLYMVEVGDLASTGGVTLERASQLFHEFGPRGTPTSAWFSPPAILHWRYLYHLVLVEALLVASLIDYDLKMIPDSVTAPAMLLGLAGGTMGCVHIVPLWVQDPGSVRSLIDGFLGAFDSLPGWVNAIRHAPATPAWPVASPHLHGLAVSVAGLITGGGVIWLVRLVGHWVLKQEAMGFGDVTLMAAIGSFIGWQPVLVVFFVAPLLAVVFGLAGWFLRRQRELPYGPFLAAGTLYLLCGWNHIWPRAESIFGWGPFFLVLLACGGIAFVPLLTLTRALRRLMGIPDPLPSQEDTWRAADQLHYFAGETIDRFQGRWRCGPGTHPVGEEAGRGQRHESNWRGRNR